MILIVAMPLLIIGIGLTVRPLPLRVNAAEPAERMAQHCQRISFVLLGIPAIVTGIVIALIIRRFNGGPGLLAYGDSLSIAGNLWKISSIAGILSGAAGSYFSKQRGQGYQLVVTHMILFFIMVVAPYLQYAGHPD